jgi:alkylation response protein AidB-like acyl-CoA dehydrogenase
MSHSRERADQLITWFRSYAERRLNSRLMDERRSLPPSLVLDLGNQGFLGLQVGQDQGGLALDTCDLVRVLAQVAAVDITLALLLGIHNGLGLRPLQHFAAPGLQDKWLRALATGRGLAAFALTEPGAGSNPQALAATARQVPGGWEVDAHKCWIGLGAWASVLIVFARAIDAQGKTLGTLALLVESDNPGLSMGAEALTMGVRGIVQNEVYLSAAFVPDSHVLGKPGGGLGVAQDAMMHSRLGIASVCVGGLKRAAQLMARYAARRTIGTGLLLENAVTLEALGEVICQVDAADALVTRVAAWVDSGALVPPEAYLVCKTACPELLYDALDRLAQVLGGRGYIESNGVPQMLRDARLLRIFEGPTEPLLMHLGTLALGRPKGLARLIGEGFGAPLLAIEVATALQGLETAYAALPFADGDRRSQWGDYQAGRVASAAVLLAALPETSDKASLASSRKRYERTLADALAWQGPLPEAQSLLARAASFAQDIGNLEQTLPGEDFALDALLRREWPGEGV